MGKINYNNDGAVVGAVAKRYARAFFEYALEQKVDLEKLEQELAGLVYALESGSAYSKVLYNKVMPKEKRAVIINILKQNTDLSQDSIRLLEILNQNNRMHELPSVVDEFGGCIMSHQGKIKAVVESANPMSDVQQDQMREILHNHFQKDIILEAKVDEGLIGGFKVYVRSQICDMTIFRTIANLRKISANN